jgi:exonuclease SbcC
VSLFYGVNGSGKSSILRAIFAGLFQSSACSQIPSGGRFKIEDFRRNGTGAGSVELEFTHNNKEYTVYWKFSDNTEACRLYEDEILIAESTSDVGDTIQDLINMDSEAFVNSTYVQQTELMRMITSKRSERKKVFDSLLGIDKIEQYIDRAHESEMGVKDAVKQIRNQLASLEDQITTISSTDELETSLTQTRSDISQKESQVEQLSTQIDKLETKIDQYQDSISEKEELTAEEQELKDEINEQKDIVSELQDECSTLESTVQQKKQQLENAVSSTQIITEELDTETIIEEIEPKISQLKTDQITTEERSVYQNCQNYTSSTVQASELSSAKQTVEDLQELPNSSQLALPNGSDFVMDPEELLNSYRSMYESVTEKVDRLETQIS